MATNYNKSNYGLNKLSKGIVYKNADGSILEITFEKIAADNPQFTQADFDKIKELSDAMYHEEAKTDALYSKYVKSTLDENVSSDWLATDALEYEIFKRADEREFTDKIYKAITTLLTETEKRRLLLYAFRGLTTREIAQREETSQPAVWKSISKAQSKIKKFLINF